MYLSARKYVSAYDFRPINEQNEYEEVLAAVGLERKEVSGLTNTPSGYVELTVAYWRKDNQIHDWFVKNCQDGVDECQKAYVSREQLTELVGLCEQVLAEPDKAKEILPVSEGGFFFGSYEYDEWYYEGVKHTITMLKAILDNPKFAEWEYQYQSSW
jgi:hypothetical protein